MKILILGQGGREHALIKCFKKSKSVSEIHALPGNDGIQQEAICHSISLNDFDSILALCKKYDFSFVFVGPEDPLVAGITDYLRQNQIPVIGPDKNSAQLEGSKIFSKKFMLEAKVPTARSFIVSSTAEAIEKSKNFSPPFVLKADGLAAGKGVFICKNQTELTEACNNIFEKKILGKAGEIALLEEFTPGWELSYLILTNGTDFTPLPLAQDHKRLLDNDKGPNTGGMGTIAPLKISDELNTKIIEQVIKPTIKLINEKNYVYRGVLFIGLMINNNEPSVLEYNVRLGDPETQVILPLIDNDCGLLMRDLSLGKLQKIQQNNLSSCCVISASPGYPDNPEKGLFISGLNTQKENEFSYHVHAGTLFKDNQWLTNGGRVIGSIGIDTTIEGARKKAYDISANLSWSGLQKRSDIGLKN